MLLRPLLLCALVVLAHAGEGDFPFRWRSYADQETGIAVRYPYNYLFEDFYTGDLNKAGGSMREKIVEVDGRKVRMMVPVAPEGGIPDMRIFSVNLADAPGADRDNNIGVIANAAAKVKWTWTSYDYYTKHEERPFADKKFAPKNLEAMRAESDQGCGIVVKHGDRISGVIVKGGLSQGDNEAILNSFEIMNPGRGKNPALTWREIQLRSGKVFDAAGKPIAARGQKKGASWAQGWDVDTAHYHITTHVSPQRLLEYAAYLEIVFEAFNEIYQIERIPPYKMEIHIFNEFEDFQRAAAANGFSVGQGVGGFFVPIQDAPIATTMSIFVYEGSKKWGGDDFSVEHVLAHECSHQFLHVATNKNPKVPTWLNEGLAVYFEAGKVQGNKLIARPPSGRIEQLKAIYNQRNNTITPVDEYLSHYGRIDASQYGEVYAMTHFWLFGTCKPGCQHKPGQCGLAHFREYWKRLKAKENGTKAFEETFMEGMIKAKGSRESAISAWQSAYFEYVKKVLK